MPTYADELNMLGDDIDFIKKNAETYTDASKEVGLDVKARKTKHMVLSQSSESRAKS
jgi:hypothetical protein